MTNHAGSAVGVCAASLRRAGHDDDLPSIDIELGAVGVWRAGWQRLGDYARGHAGIALGTVFVGSAGLRARAGRETDDGEENGTPEDRFL